MFTAYFDASGDPEDTPILTVAGLIAPVDAWLDFNIEWRAYLDSFDVSELHMKLFAHSEGAFASWRGNESKRRRFLADGMSLIEKHHTHSFGASVVCKGYRNEAGELLLHHLPIYAYMGCVCIRMAKQWADSVSIPFDDILFVFADGDIGKGKLQRSAELVFNTTPIFKQKANIHAFEAADLLAYEQYRAVGKREEKGERLDWATHRLPFQRLAASLKGSHQWEVYTDADIQRVSANAYAEYFSQIEE